jgi:hypothetical protein
MRTFAMAASLCEPSRPALTMEVGHRLPGRAPVGSPAGRGRHGPRRRGGIPPRPGVVRRCRDAPGGRPRRVPSLLELMDRTTVRAVEDFQRMGLDVDAAALLLARSDAGPVQGMAEVERIPHLRGRGGDVRRPVVRPRRSGAADGGPAPCLPGARAAGAGAARRRAVAIGRIPEGTGRASLTG